MSTQLFRVVKDVGFPLFPIRGDGKSSSSVHSTRTISMAFFWPDGSPCVPVEAYLLERSQEVTVRELDGGSLKVTASHLSHLIRYCSFCEISLFELNDSTFRQFVVWLQKSSTTRLHERRRKSTSNKAIVRTCVAFLTWVQSNLVSNRTIVGPPNDAPQIRLQQRTAYDRYGGIHQRWSYPFEPHADAPDPKGPISNNSKERLWDAIFHLANKSSDENISRNYLVARRELLLTLLEATGARPSELCEMSLRNNHDTVSTQSLRLPTKKRRMPQQHDPQRRIPCAFEVSILLENFINGPREDLIQHLISHGYTPNTSSVLLSVRDGSPLNAAAVEKEFQRLVKHAGISERACMSMFRHRFITIQVALHLRDYLATAGDLTRDKMVIVDQVSLLTRVAQITGHAQPTSLLPYIDLAWEYLRVFDPVEKARSLEQTIAASIPYLRSLSSSIHKQRLSKEALISKVIEELEGLQTRMRNILRS